MDPKETVVPEVTPDVLESQVVKDFLADAIKQATEPLQASIGKLEAVNADLKNEKTTVVNQHKELQEKIEGIDIDAMKAQLAEAANNEERELLARGEHETVFEKRLAQTVADADSRVNQADAKTDAVTKERDDERELSSALRNTLVLNVRDGGISQAFVATEADKSQLRSAQAIAKDSVLVKGEWLPVVAVDNLGQSEFRHSTTGEILQNAAGDFGYKDWLVHLAEKEGLPLFAKPNSHSNPNAISEMNPKGLVKSKMSQAEKQQFKAEFGIKAFDALPFS